MARVTLARAIDRHPWHNDRRKRNALADHDGVDLMEGKRSGDHRLAR